MSVITVIVSLHKIVDIYLMLINMKFAPGYHTN